MKIIHLAAITTDKANGVCVTAPQHVLYQSKFAQVKFCNINNIEIEEIKDYQVKTTKEKTIIDVIKEFTPNLVVFHEAYRPQYLKIAAFLRKNKIPYVIVPHGELKQAAQKHNYIKKLIANILLFNRFINNAIAIQCLSEGEKEATKFKAHKIIGTNGTPVCSIQKSEFNSTDIVYIGRLDAYTKGLDLMLAACNKIKEQLLKEHIKVHIYGPDYFGRKQFLLELINKFSLEQLVEIHDPVFGEEKIKVLMESKFFMQTSRTEGMPIGILEALSMGVPCLITEGTTLGTIMKQYNAGWVAKTDVNSIAATIQYAIADGVNYFKKATNAKTLVEENFNWEKISQKTIKIYEGLLEATNDRE